MFVLLQWENYDFDEVFNGPPTSYMFFFSGSCEDILSELRSRDNKFPHFRYIFFWMLQKKKKVENFQLVEWEFSIKKKKGGK